MIKFFIPFLLISVSSPAFAEDQSELYDLLVAKCMSKIHTEPSFGGGNRNKTKTICRPTGGFGGEVECETEEVKHGFTPESELRCKGQAKDTLQKLMEAEKLNSQ